MRFFAVFVMMVLVSVPAFAEDKKQPPMTPVTKWMAAESAVVAKLSDEERDYYFILRNKYGLIRALRIVRDDVGRAVQECGLANPDMQDRMNVRYDAWRDSVDPILRDADRFLNAEIKTQKMVSRRTFNKMTELNDEAYDFQKSAIEKNVNTSAGSCERLLASMDRTEEDMLRLMSEILLPVEQIQEQGEEG